jgi:hypothetical protein
MPACRRYLAYYRVSTDKQGYSGLGLDAQRAAVQAYLTQDAWALQAEFTEVESGQRADRPVLASALAACRGQAQFWSSPNSTGWPATSQFISNLIFGAFRAMARSSRGQAALAWAACRRFSMMMVDGRSRQQCGPWALRP